MNAPPALAALSSFLVAPVSSDDEMDLAALLDQGRKRRADGRCERGGHRPVHVLGQLGAGREQEEGRAQSRGTTAPYASPGKEGLE